MAGGAQLRGADQFVRTLHAAASDLDDLTDVEDQAGQLLAEQGSRNSPRRTGRLSRSHGSQVVAGGFAVVADAPYSAIVHARNPWLTRTVLAAEDQVVDLYAAGVDERLAQVKGT